MKTRFESKFEMEPMSGCWLWTAGVDTGGYGMFWMNRTNNIAHRVSYELYVGPIPDGLTLDHLCRVRTCVNPSHLEPVSQRENILRGVGFISVLARQTTCKNGHELIPENIHVRRGRRWRECKACRINGRLKRRLAQ